MICTRAVAFCYEVHVPMHSSHAAYGSSAANALAAPTYSMRSTSAAGTSMCRTSNDLAMLGGATGRFSTYVYGVGEECGSAAYLPSKPRREPKDPDDPGSSGDVDGVIGDLPLWALAFLMFLYLGYKAYRQRRRICSSTNA